MFDQFLKSKALQFRLELHPRSPEKKINHQHKLLLIGSCFTENIGEKLAAHKFAVLQNPNGILFNPVSVKDSIESYIQKEEVNEGSLFFLQEAWHSWKHHSRFSSPVKSTVVASINASVAIAHEWLKETNFLMITLGSAWVYELTSEAQNARLGSVAANNHKAPANWFHRRLLSTNEVIHLLQSIVTQLQQFNAGIAVIFTISPVRHIREGFVENNRSKAVLISAVHETVEKNEHCFYFPAYELVMDDLRDYRFFAEDMVHPNYAATQYVWEKFVQACIDTPSQLLMKEINEINAAKCHRPFNEQSQLHKSFLSKYLAKTKMIAQSHPWLNFQEELNYFGAG